MHKRHNNLFNKQLFHDIAIMWHVWYVCVSDTRVRERYTCVRAIHVCASEHVTAARDTYASIANVSDSKSSVLPRQWTRDKRLIIYRVVPCRVAHASCADTCKNPLNANWYNRSVSAVDEKRYKVRLKGRAREEVPGTRQIWYIFYHSIGTRRFQRLATRQTGHVYTYTPLFLKYIILFVVFHFECNLLSPLISREMPLIASCVSIFNIISGNSKSLQNNSLCTDKMSLHFRWDRLHVRSSFEVFFHIFLI